MRLASLLFICLLFWNPVVFAATDFSQDINCQGYFPQEEDGSDSETDLGANTSNDLTVNGGDTIPRTTDKVVGTYARDYEDGDADFMWSSDGNELDINGSDQYISIFCQIKAESFPSGTDAYVSKYDTGGNQRQYALNVNSSGTNPRFNISHNGSTSTVCEGATTLSTGQYYAMGGVYNDIDARFYLDGSLDSNGSSNPKTFSSGLFNGTAQFRVGGWISSGSPNSSADAIIDDVGVLDRVATSAEVLSIANNGFDGSLAAAATAPLPIAFF